MCTYLRDTTLVIVYFAGHGSPEQENPPDRISRYLVPYDAEYEYLFSTGIGMETDIDSLLERQYSRRLLFVLDTCFSGKAGGRGFIGPNLASRLAQYRAPLSLQELHLGFGRAIMTACADNEFAKENKEHGVFTAHLIKALSGNDTPTIGIGALYEEIYSGVVEETKDTQHPVLKGRIEGMRLPSARSSLASTRNAKRAKKT